MPLTRRESVLEFERYHRAFSFPSTLPQFWACLQPALSIRQDPSVSLVVSWNSDFRPWPGWSEQTTPLLEVSAYFGDAWTNIFGLRPLYITPCGWATSPAVYCLHRLCSVRSRVVIWQSLLPAGLTASNVANQRRSRFTAARIHVQGSLRVSLRVLLLGYKFHFSSKGEAHFR